MTQDVVAARAAEDEALQALLVFTFEHRAGLEEMVRMISRITAFLPECVHAILRLGDGEGITVWAEDGQNHLRTWVDRERH